MTVHDSPFTIAKVHFLVAAGFHAQGLVRFVQDGLGCRFTMCMESHVGLVRYTLNPFKTINRDIHSTYEPQETPQNPL